MADSRALMHCFTILMNAYRLRQTGGSRVPAISWIAAVVEQTGFNIATCRYSFCRYIGKTLDICSVNVAYVYVHYIFLYFKFQTFTHPW